MDFEKELPLRFNRFLEIKKWLKRNVIGLILVENKEEANELYKNFQWESEGITITGDFYNKYITQKSYTLLLVTDSGTKILKYGQRIWVQLFGKVLHLCSDVKYYNDVHPSDIVIGQRETLRTAGFGEFGNGDLGSFFQNIIYTTFTSEFCDKDWDVYFRNRMTKSGTRHFVKVDVDFDYDGIKNRITFEGPEKSTRLFETLTVKIENDIIKYSGCYRAYIITTPSLIPTQDNIVEVIPWEPVVTGMTYTEIERKIEKQFLKSLAIKDAKRKCDPYLPLKQLKISPELMNVILSDFNTSFKAVSLNDISTDTGSMIEFPALDDSPKNSKFQFSRGRTLRRRSAVLLFNDLFATCKIHGRRAFDLEQNFDDMVDSIKMTKLLYTPSFHLSVPEISLGRKENLQVPCIYKDQEPSANLRCKKKLSAMLQTIISIILPVETENWDVT